MLVERVSHGAALGDYDNDGDVDIFVSDSDAPHCTLLRNDHSGHNYLTVEAVGTQSNRDGLGTKIRAVAGDLVQKREVRRSYGYMGSSDVRLTLGFEPPYPSRFTASFLAQRCGTDPFKRGG